MVRWVLLYAAQYGVVLIKSLLHGRGNRGGQQFCGGYIINILQRGFHIDPQDVNFIGIAQDVAIHYGALVQAVRQTVGAVPFHGGTQHGILGIIVQVIPDMPLLEQYLHPGAGVVNALAVIKGAKTAQLFKAADIVQHAA